NLGKPRWFGKQGLSRIASFWVPTRPFRPVVVCGFRSIICMSNAAQRIDHPNGGTRTSPLRPHLNELRRKFDIVMAWAINRLGRSLSDLLDTIQHLEACGVDLYLDQQAIDTTIPMGKLVFS